MKCSHFTKWGDKLRPDCSDRTPSRYINTRDTCRIVNHPSPNQKVGPVCQRVGARQNPSGWTYLPPLLRLSSLRLLLIPPHGNRWLLSLSFSCLFTPPPPHSAPTPRVGPTPQPHQAVIIIVRLECLQIQCCSLSLSLSGFRRLRCSNASLWQIIFNSDQSAR